MYLSPDHANIVIESLAGSDEHRLDMELRRGDMQVLWVLSTKENYLTLSFAVFAQSHNPSLQNFL